jgi:hypothetical protein
LQVGTIAGNLSIKHEHPEFPSDVFLLLVTVGATLTIGELSIWPKFLNATPTLETWVHNKTLIYFCRAA